MGCILAEIQKINISEDELELYGKYKAKISDEVYERLKDNAICLMN